MDERSRLIKRNNPHLINNRIQWFPIILLAVWRASHALYFGYIFTWITPFILENGLADQANIGRIAGWIESAYSIGVLSGLAPAAVLSDAYGRKPIALIGVLISSFATACFGFTSTLSQMIILRFLIGLFVSFVPVTVVVMMIEMSTPKTQPRILAINSVSWQFGDFVAPFFGGVLSTPAKNWPNYFTGTIWQTYPYALPGVAVVVLPLGAALLALCCLEETLKPSDKKSLSSRFRFRFRRHESRTSIDSGPSMITKPVVFVLFMWFFIIFLSVAALVTEVLFLSTDRSVGGLAFTPKEMAILFGVRPLINNTATLITYPTLVRRLGSEKLFRLGVYSIPIPLYLAYFILGRINMVHPLNSALNLVVLFILAIPTTLLNHSGTALFQTMTCRAPTRNQLSQMNAASEYAANIGHGLAAIVASSFWTFSVKHDYFNGQATYLALVGFSVILLPLASRLTEEKSWTDPDPDPVAEVEAEVDPDVVIEVAR